MYYLSKDIIIDNNKIYKIYGKRNILLTKQNWYKYLSSIGWERLDLKWVRKLNKYGKNGSWGLLDCGGNGDCMFLVIAKGLNQWLLLNNKSKNNYYTNMKLRKIASECITEKILDYCITNETLDELKQRLIKGGDSYWGDWVILQLLRNKLKLNILIFGNDGKLVNTLLDFVKEWKTIILYYEYNVHFKLVGYFINGMMKTIFNKLPSELEYLMQN